MPRSSRPSLVALPELCSLARTPCAMPCTRRSRCATHRRSATTSSVRVGSPVQHTINRRCNIQYSHLLGLAQQRRPQCVNAPAWQCALLRSSWSVAARSTHARTHEHRPACAASCVLHLCHSAHGMHGSVSSPQRAPPIAGGNRWASTAQCTNCSLCVIKPHAVRELLSGKVPLLSAN